MAREVRVDFVGAVWLVLDRWGAIFGDDDDRQTLLHRRLPATRRRFELTNAVRFEQDQCMKFVRVLGGILLVSALALGTSQAMGEGDYQGQPLTQVEFTRLIPITYPLATARFTALKPTSYPVIQPGVARVHIIEKLVHPMELPLLRTIKN